MLSHKIFGGRNLFSFFLIVLAFLVAVGGLFREQHSGDNECGPCDRTAQEVTACSGSAFHEFILPFLALEVHAVKKVSCGRVDTKNLHEIGYLSEMPKRVLRGFIVSAQKIDIKDVLPWTSSHGSRFNLAQADIAQGEYAQRFKECSRHVLHFEGNGSLIGSPGNQALINSPSPRVRPTRTADLSYQKETGEVALLIFNPSFQDLA